VVLLPDDALNWLNFETLPVYGTAAGENTHYWIEDVRAVTAPSLSVLKAGPTKPPRSDDSLLIIGDPAAHDPGFPKLAYAAKEIETIEAKFPASEKKKLTGAVARPDAYREAGPGKYSLLHFSAHAVANKESPLDSAIILSGESDNFKLYARNIIDTPLNANLVTISACRSAGARSYSGEGLVGFVWAFLQAGARNVIAGLWDVTDSSTPGLMDVLYTKIASGMNPADACRAAKLSMIHSTTGYRRPYYWGPFQLFTRDVEGLRELPAAKHFRK
jgi:CHAT domain-containing protein